MGWNHTLRAKPAGTKVARAEWSTHLPPPSDMISFAITTFPVPFGKSSWHRTSHHSGLVSNMGFVTPATKPSVSKKLRSDRLA